MGKFVFFTPPINGWERSVASNNGSGDADSSYPSISAVLHSFDDMRILHSSWNCSDLIATLCVGEWRILGEAFLNNIFNFLKKEIFIESTL